jgi:seryl-tRNA synthetase
MHNLKDLRSNLDYFKKKLKERNVNFDSDNFSKKDSLNRELINKKEKLEQEKKFLSKSKDKLNFTKSKKISVEIADLTKKQFNSQNNLEEIIFSLPNLAHDDVPIGKDEKSNKLIKKVGDIKNFSFKIKSHIEIGARNGGIDFDTSTKLSGSRFVVLKDKFAMLERALINFMLDTHVNEFKYTEISPPLIVNEDVMFGTGQIPKYE